MAKRKSPVSDAMACGPGVEMEPHEQMASEMHSALYALQDQARKPHAGSGEKLLPKHLRSEKPGMEEARTHIKRLHKAFKGEK